MTLGAHEVGDLEVAVSHLRMEYPEATIGLWGRSMGAVTALMYAAQDPSIAGIVGSLSPLQCSDLNLTRATYIVPSDSDTWSLFQIHTSDEKSSFCVFLPGQKSPS